MGIFRKRHKPEHRLQPGDSGWEPSQEDIEIMRQKRVGEDGRLHDPIHPDAARHLAQAALPKQSEWDPAEGITEPQRKSSFWGPRVRAGGLALRHGDHLQPQDSPHRDSSAKPEK